jgi:flagella basal body P-ring formation protein FlgA
MSYLLPLVMAAAASTAPAAGTPSQIESIQDAAVSHVRSLLPPSTGQYFVTAHRLDPRLRLAPCASPLEAFVPSNTIAGPRVTAGVRCKAPAEWTVYIPVTIETEAPVLVLKHGAARGAQLGVSDVELQTRRVPGVGSRYVSKTASLEGRRLKRSLPAGNALTTDVLVQEVVVRRGQKVILLADNGNFQIRATGMALSDGAPEQRIRVQNESSARIVEGVVVSSEVVRVGL